MNEKSLRKYIRSVLKESLNTPKGEWILLDKGDPRRALIQDQIFDMVNTTYEKIGGHFKINQPGDLERYKYWVVADLDADPDADVILMAKPELGSKMGGAANDGSRVAKQAYKDVSSELRKLGGSINGVGNWWGEVSGTPAYAMLSRGAPAVEDKAKVAKLLAGDQYTWHGAHPDPNAPPLFKSVNGWYTKTFGTKVATKIIVGSPAV
jgi:hypothetical protein